MVYPGWGDQDGWDQVGVVPVRHDPGSSPVPVLVLILGLNPPAGALGYLKIRLDSLRLVSEVLRSVSEVLSSESEV